MSYYDDTPLSELVGKTFTTVRNIDDEIQFLGDEGDYKLYHDQDCCESVSVEDVCGDLADLEGTPIVSAEELSDEPEPPQPEPEYTDESYTWTFYRFRTIKGTVTIRFYGSSNGYYSERVSFAKF